MSDILLKISHKEPYKHLEEIKAMPKPPMLESRIGTIGAFIDLEWKSYNVLRLSIWSSSDRKTTDLTSDQLDKLINDLQEIRKSLK